MESKVCQLCKKAEGKIERRCEYYFHGSTTIGGELLGYYCSDCAPRIPIVLRALDTLDKWSRRRFLCQCRLCNTPYETGPLAEIRAGRYPSCGCLYVATRKCRKNSKYEVGKDYGRWRILKEVGLTDKKLIIYECLCRDCGRVENRPTDHIRKQIPCKVCAERLRDLTITVRQFNKIGE
jgi:hypothetical protein